jgi:hypothetical protein
MTDAAALDFQKTFQELISDTQVYLDQADDAIAPQFDNRFPQHGFGSPNLYWGHLPDDLRARANELTRRLLIWAGHFAPLLKVAPLANESDQRELVIAVKSIRAAIQLRKFRHTDADYLHNEDVVLGVKPATQSDNEGLHPLEAINEVASWSSKIENAVQLVEASGNLSGSNANVSGIVDKSSGPARYRPGTAFVMMWMDKTKHELEDVSVTVKEVFAEFDIKAVRADDIEHEGLISQRVLNEITTSEFLFADLSGARQNVYYEVGYAHALGKRVILFRKGETALHFDLAGYNCPSYVNMQDLKEKLRKRLTEMTNRKAKGG